MEATSPDPGASPAPAVNPPRPPLPEGAVLVVLLIVFPVVSSVLLAWLPTGLLAIQGCGLLAVQLWARSTGWSVGPLLRLDRPPSPAALVLAAAATVVGLLGGSGVTALTEAMLPPSVLAIFDQARHFTGTSWHFWLMVVSAVVGAPVFEELAFRGGLLSAFSLRRGARQGIFLSALVFAAFHLDPVHFAGTLFLGLLYAWLALRTGSIWPSMLAHALNNGVAVISLTADRETDVTRLSAGEAALALLLGLAAWALLAAAARRWLPLAPPLDAVLVSRVAPTTAAAAPSPSGSAPPGTAG